MWNQEKVRELEIRIERIEKDNKELVEEIDGYDRNFQLQEEKHKIEIDRAKDKFDYELARVKANVDTDIATKTKQLNDELSMLTIKSQTNDEKVKMYEKAFENLGFDVKDMKEILNKLVDGLIAKNQIQLVK